MNIVIVGGGTAGWVTALMITHRHPNHKITVIESTKIGVIGVGESTTGMLTDLLINHNYQFGLDHNEFIIETGATLKYSIKHKGWTNNIDEFYQGPIDGSDTKEHTPDPLFSYAMANLSRDQLLNASTCGYWIDKGLSNMNKWSKTFNNHRHAMHVDAHLVSKYFKKHTLKKSNASHIDNEVIDAELDERGYIKSVRLKDNSVVEGDLFIDCSGFAQILMKKMPGNKWNSYQKNLPLNTGLPFQLKYLPGETPEPFTTAWAQKNGWMWQIPLMDRKGCGYVFCDAYTTPEKAQKEIEIKLGREIDPIKVIKFDTGRQDSAWINNCITIGLSSAFLEPLEATSIHTTIVQGKVLAFEYIQSTLEDTVNPGSINVYNHRTRTMFDDVKDFLVMHYMGGRQDSEFWKYISTGVTKTPAVENLLEMAKHRMPTINDFPQYYGSAGWALYSYVMEGIGRLNKPNADREINIHIPGQGNIKDITKEYYWNLQDQHAIEGQQCLTYKEFIEHYRKLRYEHGSSDNNFK
jgi:tryptophan halogenase